MYVVYELEEWIGVPPERQGDDIDSVVLEILRDDLEGRVVPGVGLVIAVLEASVASEGVILPIAGDPDVYYLVRYKVLAFEPVLLEVVKGHVTRAMEMGLMVSLGPIEGIVHRSQIMDERVEFLPDRSGFKGTDSGRVIGVGDRVRARITELGRPSRATRMFKIGLTMRQPYLGKEEWYLKEKVKQSGS